MVLFNGYQDDGTHEIVFDFADLLSEVYFLIKISMSKNNNVAQIRKYNLNTNQYFIKLYKSRPIFLPKDRMLYFYKNNHSDKIFNKLIFYLLFLNKLCIITSYYNLHEIESSLYHIINDKFFPYYFFCTKI